MGTVLTIGLFVLITVITSFICKIINQNTFGTTSAYIRRYVIVWVIVCAIVCAICGKLFGLV